MTLARLIAAILICSLPAFAQDKFADKGNASRDAIRSVQTNTEPSTIARLPHDDVNNDPNDGVTIFRYDHGKIFPDGRFQLKGRKAEEFIFGPDVTLDADLTCYTIRSYVVARDSKNSDSVHPAGYSTCQKASKYKVKTAAGDPVSLER